MTAPASLLATLVKPAVRLATGDAVGAAAGGFEAMLALLAAAPATGESGAAGLSGEAAPGDGPAEDPANALAPDPGASVAVLAGWLGRPGEASWITQTLGQAQGQAGSEASGAGESRAAQPAASGASIATAFAPLTAPTAATAETTPVTAPATAPDTAPGSADAAARLRDALGRGDALRLPAADSKTSAGSAAADDVNVPATFPVAGKAEALASSGAQASTSSDAGARDAVPRDGAPKAAVRPAPAPAWDTASTRAAPSGAASPTPASAAGQTAAVETLPAAASAAAAAIPASVVTAETAPATLPPDSKGASRKGATGAAAEARSARGFDRNGPVANPGAPPSTVEVADAALDDAAPDRAPLDPSPPETRTQAAAGQPEQTPQALAGKLDAAGLATPATPARVAPETVTRLAAGIVEKLGGQATRFDLQLDPHGLGKVDVSVEIGSDGRLAASLKFDNAQAASDLRGRAQDLRQALEQAGFSMGEGGLSFDFAGQNRGQDQTFDDSGRSDRAGRAFARALGALDEEAALPIRFQTRRGLDLLI